MVDLRTTVFVTLARKNLSVLVPGRNFHVSEIPETSNDGNHWKVVKNNLEGFEWPTCRDDALVNLFQDHPFEKLLLNDEIVALPFGEMAQESSHSAVSQGIHQSLDPAIHQISVTLNFSHATHLAS
jgi:hypothetical protein